MLKVEEQKTKPCNVIFVATRGFALFSSRRLLIKHMRRSGYHVVIATADDEYSRDLVERGVTLVPIEFGRRSVTPALDIKALISLWKAYIRFKPVLIHHFNAKPLILGSIAAVCSGSGGDRKIINTVTGLGHAFVKGGVVRAVAGMGYKMISPFVDMTIFQNRDDRDLFLSRSWVKRNRSRLVIGSGVDTGRFSPREREGTPEIIDVLMIGRLLKQKGVAEYIEMATMLKQRYSSVRFVLGGEEDRSHPDAISRELIEQAVQQGVIDYIGYVEDFDRQLNHTSIFVYPSYYREGVPRVVMEAAASGVPVVGANVPGTREAIQDGITGYLVAPRDSATLAEKVARLIDDGELRRVMGQASRKLAETCFDIREITRQQIDVYSDIGIEV